MKTVYLSIIAILTLAIFISINTVFAQDVIGRELAPFIFHLDEKIMNGTDWSYLEDGRAAAVVMKGEGIELPLKIISATTEPVKIEFHSSIGNEQVGHIKMPRGVVIQIEPKEILLKPDHDEMIKIKVKVDKNAPSNKYDVKLVGQWLGPNGFMGTSFSLHVGRDFGPTSIAVNFFPSPLKQTKDGVLPTEVVCTNDYVLILKKSNNSPACVKPTSTEKLIKWDWAKTREAVSITENDIMKNAVIRPEVRLVNGSADVAVDMSLTAIATNSTGFSRAEYDITGLPTYAQDNNSIQLTLYHGTISGSDHVIAATIKNIGDRVVYVESIDIEGMVPTPSGTAGFVSVLQAHAILSSIETTLQPDESLTAFIVGDWSVIGIPVTGFASQITYSHEDPDANYRFGFSTKTPIQWIQ